MATTAERQRIQRATATRRVRASKSRRKGQTGEMFDDGLRVQYCVADGRSIEYFCSYGIPSEYLCSYGLPTFDLINAIFYLINLTCWPN